MSKDAPTTPTGNISSETDLETVKMNINRNNLVESPEKWSSGASEDDVFSDFDEEKNSEDFTLSVPPIPSWYASLRRKTMSADHSPSRIDTSSQKSPMNFLSPTGDNQFATPLRRHTFVSLEHGMDDEIQNISYSTAQRCLACQRYFVDYYESLSGYLEKRKERYEKFRSLIETDELDEATHKAMMEKFYQQESQILRKRRTRIKVSHFNILTRIGIGAFGQVFLAVKSDTNEICAIKKMSKSHLYKMNKAENVMAEKDILSIADSPWLVKLLYSFQDAKYLYLAMEYVPGGDLRSLLRIIGTLPEKEVSFYASEMISAISALHGMGYYHRDVKPENFLIDKYGHIKLTDFGLSKNGLIQKFTVMWREKSKSLLTNRQSYTGKQLLEIHRLRQKKMEEKENSEGRVFSVVGSPDYMAPELLLGNGSNHVADYWAVGCIIFEMLYGFPPFSRNTVEEVFQAIISFNGILEKPSFDEEVSVSPEAWDLLGK